MTAIVGIRYIGAKAPYTERVVSSGASWDRAGDVCNFSAPLAAIFLKKHPDMFEEAPVDHNATVYLSVPNMPQPKPVAIISLKNATAQQLVNFARLHLGRTLNDGDSMDTLRMQVMHGIQAQALTQASELHRFQVPFALSAEEYAAYMAGTVELRLVPVAIPAEVTEQPLQEELDKATATDSETENLPSIEELVAALDGAELTQFAAEQGMAIDAEWGEDETRDQIVAFVRASRAAAEPEKKRPGRKKIVRPDEPGAQT